MPFLLASGRLWPMIPASPCACQVFADKRWRRIILDPRARTPLTAKVISDEHAASTIVVVTKAAPVRRVSALSRRVRVLGAPAATGGMDLQWLLKKLGEEDITSLLVEGGGETKRRFSQCRSGCARRLFLLPIGNRRAQCAKGGQRQRHWKTERCACPPQPALAKNWIRYTVTGSLPEPVRKGGYVYGNH